MQIPSSTYRVQLHREFTFEELKSIVEYLHELGISTIYAAPIGTATPGSTHGYDVTDANRINPEVGDRRDLQELRHVLRENGMTWLQDIVPNHMAFSTHNQKLMDVFERGQVSPYYNYFDINWNHPDPELNGKVMVPFLGDELDNCIARGEVKLTISENGIRLTYFHDHYPVSAETIAYIGEHADEKLQGELFLLQNQFNRPSTLEEWNRIKEDHQRVIFAEYGDQLRDIIREINANKDKLTEVAGLQYYLLTYWKKTEKKINYRRFFTVNSLICLRMEDQDVFDDYHRMISKMYADKLVHGVRIDHIDGLNDPAGYLIRLRELLGEDCYIIAEKILEASETLPQDWPIQGTSGYEFLSAVNKLFTDVKGSRKLVSFYKTIVPGSGEYEDLVLQNKKLILENHLAGEMDNLLHHFIGLGLLSKFDPERMKRAISLFMLSLSVYRVYPNELPLHGWELRLVEDAFRRARDLEAGYEDELGYLERFCTHGSDSEDMRERYLEFLRRLMQFTGPLTAKGVEDTTFYVYNPLISHDEVGDAPDVLGTSVREFHEKMVRRAITSPLSLNATATHDTKRGEDARMRLNLLSEVADDWINLVRRWMNVNREYKVLINDVEAPSINDEYFIYQSIVGGFPENYQADDEWKGRLKEYLVKVVREGKIFSSWETPNEMYEDACGRFIESILQPGSAFMKSFHPFIKDLINQANLHSVGQVVVKMTAPGIPDVYQGCELWDLSFVDPDNRRPVDYNIRMKFLRELKTQGNLAGVSTLLEKHRSSGIMKLFATWRMLNARREHESLFREGTYIPLVHLGESSGVFGYARNFQDEWCLVVVPLGATVKKVVRGIDLERNFISLPATSPARWRNIFTNKQIIASDKKVSLHELLMDFPIAVLIAD